MCGVHVLACWVVFDSLWPYEQTCSPGSSVHGIFQARILEWVAISSSRGSSRPRDQTRVSCIGRWILYQGATWEASELNGGPLNTCPSPDPSTSESDLIRIKSLFRCNSAKEPGVVWDLGWSWNPVTDNLLRKGRGRFEMQRRQRWRREWCGHKPRDAWSPRKQGVTKKDSSLQPLEGTWPWQHLDPEFRFLASRSARE